MLLTIAALLASQGEILQIDLAAEPDLSSATIYWAGDSVPMTLRQDRWVALIGIDLDADPGTYAVTIVKTFADGREDRDINAIEISARDFPITSLTVAPGYVELSPENQARAAREAQEIESLYASVAPEALWSHPFVVPIEGALDGKNFGHRRVFNGQPRAPHSGADLRAATGTPVRATNRGRVVLAKDLFFSGNAVFVDHGLGVISVYLHLSRIDVSVGQLVPAGGQVGLAGATGRVTGPHLHWGVRVLAARVDPFTLLTIEEH